MTGPPRRLLLLCALLGGIATAAQGQTYTPQSPKDLSVSFQIERLGGSRILMWGEVRNGSTLPCDRIVLQAEGLDGEGRVVSRARTYVPGPLPPKASAPFELRLSAAGTEKHYRVAVDSFEFFRERPRPESP
jgi:hypothetical protein